LLTFRFYLTYEMSGILLIPGQRKLHIE